MRDFNLDPQAIMDAHAKSFSWAAKFLSRDARAQAAQLYAYARLMDDLVDEPSLGAEADRLAQFETYRHQLLDTAANAESGHALGKMLCSLGVDQQVIHSFHDALLADAQPRHLQSLPEVLGFAYGVAGTVGQMMRPILGAQPQADRYAVALGMGMQLTNIARDVLEDAQRGRCYLPAQWLPQGWQLADLQAGQASAQRSAFAAMERLLDEAEQLYALAEQGFSHIPMPNRRAIEVAGALYRGIGRKILRLGASGYWQQRVHLSRWEKIKVITSVMCNRSDRQSAIQAKPAVDALQLHQDALQRIPGFPRASA